MSFMYESKASILGYLNAANGTNYTLSDVSFGVPVPTEGTWQGELTNKNTAVIITAPPGSSYQGQKSITYDRLNLADFSHIKGIRCSADRPATVHQLLKNFRTYTGIWLGAEDVEDSAVVDNGDRTFSATLTAKASSLGWVGSYPITISQGGVRLDEVIAVSALNGLNYPTASDQEIYAQMYLYPYDFSAFYEKLVDIEEGVPLTGEQVMDLVDMIKAVDLSSGRTLWNADSANNQWSLFGAGCLHSGLNGADLPTNPAYKYVAAITLRQGMTTPSGVLYLHYNDPIDSGTV